MREETVSLTRQQLYDLVWSRPMTAIAAEFGMSSVAFAKYCRELQVPRPGRGYWRQVTSGRNPHREKLPNPAKGTPESVVIEKYERPGLGRRPPRDVAAITVPERIQRMHPIVKELDELLRTDCHHQYMLAVRGHREVILKIGEPSRRRVLRLLHTIFTAVEARGPHIRLAKLSEESDWARGRRSLEIVIDEAPVEVTLREHLHRREHEKSEHEKRWPWMGRKYDLEPSGDLMLELRVPWGTGTRTRWRDGEKGRLEDLLGEVIWAVDEAARSLVGHRARLAEQSRLAEIARKEAEERERERQRRAEEERQRREREAREAAHRKALEDDLLRMANEWREADVVRSFLRAVEARLPEPERSSDLRRWLTWATAHAESLDPLRAPERIAKPLAPTA